MEGKRSHRRSSYNLRSHFGRESDEHLTAHGKVHKHSPAKNRAQWKIRAEEVIQYFAEHGGDTETEPGSSAATEKTPSIHADPADPTFREIELDPEPELETNDDDNSAEVQPRHNLQSPQLSDVPSLARHASDTNTSITTGGTYQISLFSCP